MRSLPLSQSRPDRRSARPHRYVISLFAALALLVLPAAASAGGGFAERIASARWSTSFQCPDGSTGLDGLMIVETDNFIDEGTTPDRNPPLRVGFTGQCPDGTFSWGLIQPALTQFNSNLMERVTARGTFTGVTDNRGGTHTVSVNARWIGKGRVKTTHNGPGSTRRQRSAIANAKIVFDGNTLVDGPANYPFPEPFIRVDRERGVG